MCNRCKVECTGLRSGKGPGILSIILGRRSCKHSPQCRCEECNRYRTWNKHADKGLMLGKRPEKE